VPSTWAPSKYCIVPFNLSVSIKIFHKVSLTDGLSALFFSTTKFVKCHNTEKICQSIITVVIGLKDSEGVEEDILGQDRTVK